MIKLMQGDCLELMKQIPDGGLNCCVTSPPYYGLRDYGHDGQIGLEQTPDEYISKLVEVFREVKRVLRDDGTLWVNIGDSYASNQSNNGGYSAKSTLVGFSNPNTKGRQSQENTKPRKLKHGLKQKDLIGIPWMLAFALRADGWYLRQDIIWQKPNPMPESVRDRCTKSHEYIFLLSKSDRYFYDHEAIKEPAKEWQGRAATFDRSGNPVAEHVIPGQTAAQHRPRINEENRKALRNDVESRHRSSIPGGQSLCAEPKPTRNRRSVWNVSTKPFKGSHFAVFPPDLIEPCILAGCPEGGTVIDPFGGSGTTAGVAIKHGRKAIICELNADYTHLMKARIQSISGIELDQHYFEIAKNRIEAAA